MRTVFADAGYWIAMLVNDQLTARAIQVTAGLGEHKVITTQMVLVEVLAFASKRGARVRREAVRVVESLESQPEVEVVPQTAEQYRAAIRLYAARPDQRWSLTDCASFQLMELRGITEALAYDRDFEQAGFTPLLRESP